MDEARFAALIRRHLPFYLALVEGRRPALTAAQRRFVAVARGEVPPRTDHERAFALWRARCRRVAAALAAEPPAGAIPDAAARAEARLRLKRPPRPMPPRR